MGIEREMCSSGYFVRCPIFSQVQNEGDFYLLILVMLVCGSLLGSRFIRFLKKQGRVPSLSGFKSVFNIGDDVEKQKEN